ncbi:transposase [uncultured Fusobacterium sp.]|uniref:transposase n=1 Tax=uncultured Fusobacterium sp. TaxID=159267 RepID=UPI00343943DE
MCVINTFARYISWNPHIHCIFTIEVDSNNNWISFKSLLWEVLRASWQKCTLDILSDFARKIILSL